MFVFIELTCSLATYFVVTKNKETTRLVYLTTAVIALILAGLILGNIWVLLVFLLLLAGFGVLIGVLLGAGVNFLSSKVDRTKSKRIIWVCGFALVVVLSFHSKYRSTYEALTACNDQAQQPQTVSVVFEGLSDSPFDMVLEPAFASVLVSTEWRGSFLLGQSIYDQNFTGSKLRPVTCDLTRNFSRPIPLEAYQQVIRIDNETGRLLKPKTEQKWDTFSYIPIRFEERRRSPRLEQETVEKNGQVFRVRYNVLYESWRFYTQYHGLSMAFDLKGKAGEPPVDKASMVFEIFDSLEYFVPANSEP